MNEKFDHMEFKRAHRAEKRAAVESKLMNIVLDEEKTRVFDQFVEFYQQMHENPKWFLGMTTQHHVRDIRKLVRKHHAKTLLDYGCGKGIQYLGERLHEHWSNILPHCYDPGVRGLHKKPTRQFDGVICCDVLEHIPELLIPDTISELGWYAKKFLFVNVAVRPAGKFLPNGENVHVTVHPREWWEVQFHLYLTKDIDFVLNIDDLDKGGSTND